MTDDSDFKDSKEVMGRLKEAVHYNGYTAVRACSALEWLLIDDRWRQADYEDFDAFLEAINVSQYKFAIDQRQRLAQMLAEKHKTQRQIAKALGCDHSTISRDLRRGANAPAALPKPKQTAAPASPSGANAPDWLGMDGAAAAATLERQTQLDAKRRQAEARIDQRRQANWDKVQGATNLDELLRSGARFTTIVIDPAWEFPDDASTTLFGRAAAPPYKTMPLDEIAALPVAQLAGDDSHLYCWITNRALLANYDHGLLEHWGFTPKEILTWAKSYYGIGFHYFRHQTEHILFGVRGSLPIKRRDLSNLIVAPRGSRLHSAKPIEAYERIEAASPGPYLELFGRGEPRPGWVSWGEDGVVVGPDKMIVSESGQPLSDDQNERHDVSSI